jgi:hypothetical protein
MMSIGNVCDGDMAGAQSVLARLGFQATDEVPADKVQQVKMWLDNLYGNLVKVRDAYDRTVSAGASQEQINQMWASLSVSGIGGLTETNVEQAVTEWTTFADQWEAYAQQIQNSGAK